MSVEQGRLRADINDILTAIAELARVTDKPEIAMRLLEEVEANLYDAEFSEIVEETAPPAPRTPNSWRDDIARYRNGGPRKRR